MPRPPQDPPSLPAPWPELPQRLNERCLAYLRGLLLDGGLEPGQRVPVEAVARALGASRQPVMEAVKRLATEGFVQVRPQVGSVVARPSPGDIADFFQLFAPAEALMARWAAERRDAAEAEAFLELAAEIAARARRLEDPRGFRRLNREYHAAIHAMARSPEVSAAVMALWDRSDFMIRAAAGSLRFNRRTDEAHQAIAEAIAAADPATAEAAARTHLERVAADVVGRLGASR